MTISRFASVCGSDSRTSLNTAVTWSAVGAALQAAAQRLILLGGLRGDAR